ncbi:MAG: GNAT family N-acetyltransferase [Verrucomicrobia bacterium]|nr:GNAT family N-acetyltransferase [Verrucomicrobiota bacterium]
MAKLPIFATERLILREVTEADATAYEKNFVDYEIISQLASVVPWPYPPGGVLDFIRHQIVPRQGNDRWVWGIFLKEQPSEIIGVVDLWRTGTPENRGFWLGRRYWGKGIMTEAVFPIMDYAFDVLGFEKLCFSNAVGNKRSRRVKEKTGAQFLRIEPGTFVSASYTEREIWELTRDRWREFKSRQT